VRQTGRRPRLNAPSRPAGRTTAVSRGAANPNRRRPGCRRRIRRRRDSGRRKNSSALRPTASRRIDKIEGPCIPGRPGVDSPGDHAARFLNRRRTCRPMKLRRQGQRSRYRAVPRTATERRAAMASAPCGQGCLADGARGVGVELLDGSRGSVQISARQAPRRSQTVVRPSVCHTPNPRPSKISGACCSVLGVDGHVRQRGL